MNVGEYSLLEEIISHILLGRIRLLNFLIPTLLMFLKRIIRHYFIYIYINTKE